MYALSLLRFINHINVSSLTSMRYYHFTKNVLDCICTEFYEQSRFIQMIHLIFFQNLLFIDKMQFWSSKTAWSASRCNFRASKMFMMTSYLQVHCDHVFAKNLSWRIFRAINIHLIVSTYYFVLSWTPLYDLKLLIVSFS